MARLVNQQNARCCDINKPVTPIDDLAERASNKNYSVEETTLRKKLASFYRLVDLFGWSEGIYNHITVRLPGKSERFLINPFGFLYHEVTASSLLTVDIDGTITDAGASNFGINDRGYVLHSAIHAARPDVQCIVHLHTPEVIAVSSIKRGFLALSQEACFIGSIVDYDFRGTLVNLDERKSLVDALGNNNVMLLRNHGFVVCGSSIEQAFFRTYEFLYAVRAEALLCNVPKDALLEPSQEAHAKSYAALINGELSGTDSKGDSIRWPQGELDWEAWMRLLDGLGMKTGHNYRLQQWRK